jgi:hypothetical protein
LQARDLSRLGEQQLANFRELSAAPFRSLPSSVHFSHSLFSHLLRAFLLLSLMFHQPR